jgi:hypothetical protein
MAVAPLGHYDAGMTILLACVLAVAAPGGEQIPPGSVLPTDSAPARNVIVLERGGCYGACPIYRVAIDESGAVSYDGERFVKVKEHRATKVSPHVFEALVSRFRAAQFDSSSVPQECPAGIATDHPTNLLAWTHDNHVHRVEHYTGNLCAPKVLTELENAVDEATGSARWVKCDGGICAK